jgi:hypothetical protein
MGLFDRLQPKWKQADPAVRLEAVRGLKDQRVLADIAANDASDQVRLAAIAALTDQAALEKLACGDASHAGAAAAKITDPKALARVGKSAAQVAARQQAVEGISDRDVLLSIAALDPDATVRSLARARVGGANPAATYLRGMISTLPVGVRAAVEPAEYSGTLDELCQALTQDPNFLINGEVVEEDATGHASVAAPTQAPWTVPAFPLARTTVRFLAQTRTPWKSDTSEPEATSFYHIKVWRTGEDKYDAVATKKQVAPMSDPVAWSQASGSGPHADDQVNR